jgi:hypothetical protein
MLVVLRVILGDSLLYLDYWIRHLRLLDFYIHLWLELEHRLITILSRISQFFHKNSARFMVFFNY